MEYRETFDQRIETTQQSLKALLERAGGTPEQRAVIAEALETLSTSLEELYAAGEELHQQNEELYAAQQMLEEERQKYRELFEFAPDGYLLTDTAGTIREANQAAADLLHMPQDDLIGKRLAAYVARQDQKAFHQQLADLEQVGRVVDWELRLKPRGKRLIPASVAVAVARDRRGRAVGLRWQIRDITRRKQGEAALRRARDELEIRVKERTAELAQTNAALQVEVVERRRAAEEAESQARFPAENPNPVMRLSREGGLLYANEGSAPLLAEWGCALGGLVPPFWRDQVVEVLTSQATKTVDVPCGERVYSFFVVPIIPAGYVNLYGRDITIRARAEETLRQQAELLDYAHVLVRDMDSRIVSWNKGAVELYGWTRDEAIGQVSHELFQTQFPESWAACEAQLFEQGYWEGELTHTRRDGSRLVVASHQVVYRDARGQPVRILEVNNDITALKQAESQREAALEERERLLLEARQLTAELEATFDAQADAILIYDTALNVRRANPSFSAIYGFDPVGLNVKDIIVRVSCRDLDGRPTQWQTGPTARALRGEKVPGSVFLVKRADGAEVVVRTSSGLMRLEDRIIGSVTVWHDITALKRAEEQLQYQNEELQLQTEELEAQSEELHAQALNLAEGRARLQAIIDSVPEAILVADEQGQVVLANPAAERLFAAPRSGLVGLEYYAKVPRYNQDHAPIDPQHLPLFRAAVHGETHRNIPMALLWPDDQWRDVLTSAVPIRDERGRVYGAVSIYQDITERVQAESQRDAMLQQVEAALAEKEVLMREIYHRVKNNVQALIYLMDMQIDHISDEGTRQMIHELQERARTMALVHEKLYQSQNLAQIDFGDYLHDLVDNLSRAFRDGRPITWHINAESILMGVDTAIPCGLIVNELLTNALKYAFPGNHPCMERGETECEIWVDFRADGEQLTLVVGDNGVGLPPGTDRHTTNSLGLQLITVLAEYQLGGRVEVDTQAGTTFKITFTERKK
jgi:PAS domain S-box-containing protein